MGAHIWGPDEGFLEIFRSTICNTKKEKDSIFVDTSSLESSLDFLEIFSEFDGKAGNVR